MSVIHSHDSSVPQYGQGSMNSAVLIDERIVIKQKDKALKELESRVKLALSQHNQMYQLQRAQIIAEHDRQLQLAKSAIEDERASALMTLEQTYQGNLRAIDRACLAQKVSVEQQANLLELHSIQHQMAMQHAERERQWASGSAYSGTPGTQQSQAAAATMSSASAVKASK